MFIEPSSMTQTLPRRSWQSEIAFAFGIVTLVMASFGLHDRLQLEKSGVVAEGIVQNVAPSCGTNRSIRECRRANDLVTVVYHDNAGRLKTRIVYASSHIYFEGQTIKIKYLPADEDNVALAAGERGDSNGSWFQMTIGTVVTLWSGLVLIVKWTRRLRPNAQSSST
jgi:hypothetical protein